MAQGVPGLDASIFSPAQLIATARPLIAPGAVDPIPCRLALIMGDVVVPPNIPAPRPGPRACVPAGGGFGALVRSAVRLKAARAGERHASLLREALRLERLQRAGQLAPEAGEALLHRTACEMGKPETEIAGIIAWARAQTDTREPV